MVSDERRLELLLEYFGSRAARELETYRTGSPDAEQQLARRRLKLAVQTVCHHFPHGARVLDLGCGAGVGASTLAELGFEVTAVDLVPAVLQRAREGSPHAPVHWVEGPFHDKVGKQGSFDVVLSLGFLEYQERAGKELVRMRRMLKPGGLLLLSVPNTLSARFGYGLNRAWYRLAGEPEKIAVRHSFTPERLQRLLGMAGFILLDYSWLPQGEDDRPLETERSRDLWVHRVKLRTAPEMLTLSRCYRPDDTAV